MADQTMSDLEKRIRTNAVKQADQQLTRSIQSAVQAIKIRRDGAFASSSLPTHDVQKAAQELLNTHAKEIGNHAVAEFHESYSKLIQEYPELIAQAQEEAVQEHINNG
ncbi:hypothetical protein MAINES_00100 [Brevundimonas phage vB_BpoS-MaInes]|nr:hypothetical protein MAINES_00100 [Brevundimonas phage vB_BpoS-MaInes]